MKVVKILWEDSCNSNLNWVTKEDVEVELINIDSFGVVVKETDEFVSIAQNYGSEPEQFSNIVTIPRGCIKEIFVIHDDNYVRQCEQKSTKEKLQALSDGKQHLGWLEDVDKVIEEEQKPVEKVKDREDVPLSYGKELEKRMDIACKRYFNKNISLSEVFYAGFEARKELLEHEPIDWFDKLDKVLLDAPPEQLKAWKEKYFNEKPVEWSEEDERMWSQVINEIEAIKSNSSTVFEKNIAQDKIDWLKSLKDRVQPKQELSEGDKRIIDNLISQLGNLFARKLIKEETKDKYVNWLKSLRPQNTWKPSDEQMEALESATVNCAYSEYQDCLKELIVELKKLKE